MRNFPKTASSPTLTAVLFVLVWFIFAIYFFVAKFLHANTLASVASVFSFVAGCWTLTTTTNQLKVRFGGFRRNIEIRNTIAVHLHNTEDNNLWSLYRKTKTNRDSLARVFPHFASATCNFFVFWLVHLIICVLCDWLEWLLWFWFYDTQLKTALKAK